MGVRCGLSISRRSDHLGACYHTRYSQRCLILFRGLPRAYAKVAPEDARVRMVVAEEAAGCVRYTA